MVKVGHNEENGSGYYEVNFIVSWSIEKIQC